MVVTAMAATCRAAGHTVSVSLRTFTLCCLAAPCEGDARGTPSFPGRRQARSSVERPTVTLRLSQVLPRPWAAGSPAGGLTPAPGEANSDADGARQP